MRPKSEHSDPKFWPYPPQTSLIATIATFAGLLGVLLVLKKCDAWPIHEDSDTTVFIVLAIVSALPVLTAVLDMVSARGGKFEYGGVTIDFSNLPHRALPALSMPANIALPNVPVDDSSTIKIIDALKSAVTCDVVTVDLGKGHDWWETRLLVLLAGAARLERPRVVVFIGEQGGESGQLQGWGYPSKLLPHLLKTDPQYSHSYHAAQAAARQWALVEPSVLPVPPFPPSVQPGLATQYPLMAFDGGLPNPLLAEQLLAADLGQKIEKIEIINGARPISLVRLQEIFKPALYRYEVDTSWPQERQVSEFLSSGSEYVAITQNGRYQSMVSRLSLLSAFMKDIVDKGSA
jgi:hypothetical protein